MMFETLEELRDVLAIRAAEAEKRHNLFIMIDKDVFLEIYKCVKQNCKEK